MTTLKRRIKLIDSIFTIVIFALFAGMLFFGQKQGFSVSKPKISWFNTVNSFYFTEYSQICAKEPGSVFNPVGVNAGGGLKYKVTKYFSAFKAIFTAKKDPIDPKLLLGKELDKVPQEYLQQNDWRSFVSAVNVEKLDIKIAKKIYDFVSDYTYYKAEKGDNWQVFQETLDKKTGDCEDYAIGFYDLSSAKNLNARVVIGEVKIKDKWRSHAFNLLYINNKIYLVDCVFGVFDKLGDVAGNYNIKYSFDKDHIYAHNIREDNTCNANNGRPSGDVSAQ
ncbi:MAG: hypothetical protein A3J83_08140 [Elusimicrobia bacterium RIFOXYA2_FULL_40_6]|nr:MAG: hypothetical protein A3J83_08140 [Elusimicrobia bacterium RIFOXYA2_FULL_40_6]